MISAAARVSPRISADPPGREWWAAFVTDDLYVQLIREIEFVKGRQTGHEDKCDLRYKQLDEKMAGLQESVDKVVKAVGAETRKSTKLKDTVLYATISVLFGFTCWAAGQLWDHDVAHPREVHGQLTAKP